MHPGTCWCRPAGLGPARRLRCDDRRLHPAAAAARCHRHHRLRAVAGTRHHESWSGVGRFLERHDLADRICLHVCYGLHQDGPWQAHRLSAALALRQEHAERRLCHERSRLHYRTVHAVEHSSWRRHHLPDRQQCHDGPRL